MVLAPCGVVTKALDRVLLFPFDGNTKYQLILMTQAALFVLPSVCRGDLIMEAN